MCLRASKVGAQVLVQFGVLLQIPRSSNSYLDSRNPGIRYPVPTASREPNCFFFESILGDLLGTQIHIAFISMLGARDGQELRSYILELGGEVNVLLVLLHERVDRPP